MPREHWLPLLILTVVALAARGGMIAVRSAELTQDRDAYLGIAEGLRAGREYSSPGSNQATAYRPPLYPLVLAALPTKYLGHWVATVNLLSGVATVWLTIALALRLGLPKFGVIAAAAFVAIDPLLVRYASQPMTESLCTLLVTGWVWRTLRGEQTGTASSAWWTGVWFGLCALCRPTVWPAAGLIAAWNLWRIRSAPVARLATEDDGVEECFVTSTTERSFTRSRLSAMATATLGCAVVVLPWVLRNWLVMGSPILTTTHGGYTLLLGNNASFYAEVVRQPWGTALDGSRGFGQENWAKHVQREMRRHKIIGEVAGDRWMSQLAWRTMRDDPRTFVRACALRVIWFWNIVPLSDARTGWPWWIIWSVGGFYAVLWIAVAIGAFDVVLNLAEEWVPGLLIAASFAAVHLVYWSNARMRAPLVPILALLAVRGALVVAQRCRRNAGPLGRR